MDTKIDQLIQQIKQQRAQIKEIEAAFARQADTLNRRHDVLHRTMSQGLQALNNRMDDHEMVFEAIAHRLEEGGSQNPVAV